MKINHKKKTITFGTFELVAAINYIERCVTKGEQKTWKLVPEVRIEKKPLQSTISTTVDPESSHTVKGQN